MLRAKCAGGRLVSQTSSSPSKGANLMVTCLAEVVVKRITISPQPFLRRLGLE